MPSVRLTRFASAAVLVAASLGACSSRDDRPLLTSSSTGTGAGGAGSSTTTSVGTGGASTSSTSSSGSSTGGGTGGTGGGTGGSGGMISTLPNDLGDVLVMDEPNVPCVKNTVATPITVYPAGASPAAFDRLEQVGTAWMASGTAADGFVLFGADGSNPSPALTAVGATANIAGTTGPRLAVAGITGGSVLLREYDSTGALWINGGAIGTTDGTRLGIGGWFGEAVVAFQDLGEVQVAGVDKFGIVGAPFTVGYGVLGASFMPAIAPSQVGFAVGWTSETAQYKAVTTIAFTTTLGIVGTPVVVARSQRSHSLVRLVQGSTGYVLLFNGQDETSGVYVLALGSDGSKVGPAHRLLGAKRVWDIAALGDKLGLIATLDSDHLAFRALDAKGNVAGPWVCLGNPSSDPDHMGGIAPLGFGNGYAIIARGAGGSEYLLDVDVLGTGVPQ